LATKSITSTGNCLCSLFTGRVTRSRTCISLSTCGLCHTMPFLLADGWHIHCHLGHTNSSNAAFRCHALFAGMYRGRSQID
jgi:hypothetical protein